MDTLVEPKTTAKVYEFKPREVDPSVSPSLQGIVGDKTQTKNSPELFHLITGEDIVATYAHTSGNKDDFVIENPVRLVMVPDNSGRTNVMFVPFCPFSDSKKFSLSYAHVLYRTDVTPQLAAEYNRFTSKIIQPVIPGLVVPTKQ